MVQVSSSPRSTGSLSLSLCVCVRVRARVWVRACVRARVWVLYIILDGAGTPAAKGKCLYGTWRHCHGKPRQARSPSPFNPAYYPEKFLAAQGSAAGAEDPAPEATRHSIDTVLWSGWETDGGGGDSDRSPHVVARWR